MLLKVAILIIIILVIIPFLIKFVGNTEIDLNEYYILLVQIFLVVATFFLTIITALPFIKNEREKHYNKLNKDFFLPIQQLRLQQNDVFLKHELPTLPDSLIIFDMGLIHLKKHNPTYDLRTKLQELRNAIENYNSESDKLNDLFQKSLIHSFTEYKTIFDKNEIEKKIKVSTLEIYLRQYLQNIDQNLQNIDIHNLINNQIDSLDLNKKNSNILLTNVHICENCEYTINEIKEKLRNSITNEIIELIRNLKLHNNIIISLVNELNGSVKDIPKSIDNGEYDTILKCCPGIMTYVNQYLIIRK